jgi:acyl-CoA reductase-like NAD-dependent aldehyde dehydrogenase
MKIMKEETFGPVLPIARVDSVDEAIELANDTDYGLGGSVWTTSRERGERVGARIEAGGVNINNAMMHVFQFPLPMGGWKDSGMGHRMGGADGVRKYCRQQAVVSEKVDLRSETHWYPYSKRKAKVTSMVLRLIEMHDWRRRFGLKPKSTR